MDDVFDILGGLAAIAFCAAIFGGLIWGMLTIPPMLCQNRWAESGLDSKYAIGTGCLIQIGGKWIPEDRYRTIDE